MEQPDGPQMASSGLTAISLGDTGHQDGLWASEASLNMGSSSSATKVQVLPHIPSISTPSSHTNVPAYVLSGGRNSAGQSVSQAASETPSSFLLDGNQTSVQGRPVYTAAEGDMHSSGLGTVAQHQFMHQPLYHTMQPHMQLPSAPMPHAQQLQVLQQHLQNFQHKRQVQPQQVLVDSMISPEVQLSQQLEQLNLVRVEQPTMVTSSNTGQVTYQVDAATGNVIGILAPNPPSNEVYTYVSQPSSQTVTLVQQPTLAHTQQTGVLHSDGNLHVYGVQSLPNSGTYITTGGMPVTVTHSSSLPPSLAAAGPSQPAYSTGMVPINMGSDVSYVQHHVVTNPASRGGLTLMHPGTRLVALQSGVGPVTLGTAIPGSLLQTPTVMPGRFKVLPAVVQQRIMQLCQSSIVIGVHDFDDKVVSKLCLLVDSYGAEEALSMLDHLEHRMRTKQGPMRNGPGYLDVAVCSHLDVLKAQGMCPKSMKLDEYARQHLDPVAFAELCTTLDGNKWLSWDHFDQGIIQLIKRLPAPAAVEKLQEIAGHSFKNVDNIKGCIMSILNSKIREDRRRV